MTKKRTGFRRKFGLTTVRFHDILYSRKLLDAGGSVGITTCTSSFYMPTAWAILHFRWIALFEYLLQVPANGIGSNVLTLPQLKIMQEVITLSIFVPFSVLYMKQGLKWDFLWAGLCLCGAVYFMFRK